MGRSAEGRPSGYVFRVIIHVEDLELFAVAEMHAQFIIRYWQCYFHFLTP